MPITTPSGYLRFYISDLVPEVIIRTENRTEAQDRAAIWIRDALLEITADPELRDEFDELEVYGTPFVLSGSILVGATVQEYLWQYLIQANDYNIASLDVMLWTDPPTNSNRIRLNETSYQDADRISPYPGQPVKWYRFNDVIGFVPPPDKNYQVLARLYKLHPIADENLPETIILIGRNWNEVLIWAAVERGFAELLEYEKAAKVHMLLHGDPKYPGKPGLIEARKSRREKENWRRQKALRPILRRYTTHSR